MPYVLSEDEALIQATVREFAARHGLDAAAEADRHDRFPVEAIQEALGLGLGSCADAGGPGATAFALAIDELAQVDANVAASLVAHNAAVAAAQGTPFASRLAGGELAAVLVTEEAGGSDLLQPGTAAVPNGDGHGTKVTGQKVWALNAAAAKWFLLLAQAPGGPTLYAVPAATEGVSLSANEPLLGLRAAGIRTVYLTAVRLGDDAVLGAPGEGTQRVAQARLWFQLGAAAALCGCVGGALSAAARFAETRTQFGAPIGTYQAVSDGLTQMDIQLAAARSLVLAAAARMDAPDASVWTARAKAFAAEMAVPMTRQAIRIQGGTGFMREGGTERFARDVRALQFVGETTHMQRDHLRRQLLPGIEYPPTP
ncbi:MAG: hypothetical protein QOD77_1186 [Thermoplasmata archaeon]|nr:hypothetical protein [Thermoplasmata archaeon]